ncbi:MAG: PEP-CTERM sorting domain-containing protein [Deltaproteobacteria bacterium]|nr:PEP-CTERM sorting domain-containing protein [Deltaproteobacteria bacterium]
MKKLLSLCAILVFLGISNVASATPWYDTYDPADIYIASGGSLSYTHDITNDGFTPLYDLAWDYDLTVSLYDDAKGWDELILMEIAWVNQPGLVGSGVYNFNYDSNEFGASILGLVQINLLGTLDVTIQSIVGDFYFASSSLVVTGIDGAAAAPVPEPATMILLGSGLVGLAGFGRKKFFKKD